MTDFLTTMLTQRNAPTSRMHRHTSPRRTLGRLSKAMAGVSLCMSLCMNVWGAGTINVATIGEPPTLDPMVSTADVVGTISQHMFETLFTFGANWKIVPMLAEKLPTVSKDGKTVTIPLRKGVKFHNGGTMNSADVVASLERWSRVAVRGKQAAADIESITAPDANTVQIKLKNPYAPLLPLLAFNNSAAVIMPAKNQPATLTEFVGTGPYQFKERQPDRFIVLTRFNGYSARTEPADWYGGRKQAVADEIRFVPVPNANTRAESAVGGQFDYVDSLPVDALGRVQASKAVDPVLIQPFGAPFMFFNTKQGSVTDAAIRRAILASLNMGDMLEAAFGDKKFYSVDGAFYPAGFPFHSNVGLEGYNQANPTKARDMAKAAGYKGQTIRILTSGQYEFHLKMAQVAAQYMKQAGFNVDLQVSDWATLTTRRGDPALWEIYFTHSAFLPEPALSSIMNNNAPGWWATPGKNQVVELMNRETNPDLRRAMFGNFQRLLGEEVPIIKIGNFNVLSAKNKKLTGFTPAPWPYFWNTSVKQP